MERKVFSGFQPYNDDEAEWNLPSVIPPPKVNDDVRFATTIKEPTAHTDLSTKFELEAIKVIEATFVKYEINVDPTTVYAELMKAGMEGYIYSILDYYWLLEDDTQYFMKVHMETFRRKLNLTFDLGDYSISTFVKRKWTSA